MLFIVLCYCMLCLYVGICLVFNVFFYNLLFVCVVCLFVIMCSGFLFVLFFLFFFITSPGLSSGFRCQVLGQDLAPFACNLRFMARNCIHYHLERSGSRAHGNILCLMFYRFC